MRRVRRHRHRLHRLHRLLRFHRLRLHRKLAVRALDGTAEVVVHPVVLGEAVARPTVGDHLRAGRVRQRILRPVDLGRHHQVAPVDRSVDGGDLGREDVLVRAVAVRPVHIRSDAHRVGAAHHVDHHVGGPAACHRPVGGVDRIGLARTGLEPVPDLLAHLGIVLEEPHGVDPSDGRGRARRGGPGGDLGDRLTVGGALVAGAGAARGAADAEQPEGDESGQGRATRRHTAPESPAPARSPRVVAVVRASGTTQGRTAQGGVTRGRAAPGRAARGIVPEAAPDTAAAAQAAHRSIPRSS